MFPVTQLLLALSLFALAGPGLSEEMKVKITPDLEGVTVQHQGRDVRIQRNQDTGNKINKLFQNTSRKCPPFCIQPMKLADGVETIDELQMLEYLKRVSEGDESVLVIDSRGKQWVRRGTIPGSINIHYKKLSLRAADEADIAQILEDTFGAYRSKELWKFSGAKTLVLFCNGMWCGQSPSNIKALLRIGYPPSKLKWYRGGMQDWENLGLTKVVAQ
jgi:rhodanese-related sulfurtransferase